MTYAATVAALGIAVAADVPVLLWGGPGQGKSSALHGLAEGLGLPLEVVIASVREPSDFAGLPVVTDGGVVLAPPSWAVRLASAGEGVVLFDEVSTAPPAVQAALLRVVLERVVGDLALPPGIRVVAAANPPEEAADGWDLAPPMANRFVHLDWALTAEVVADGFVAGFRTPPVPVLDPALVAVEARAARALVAAFLRVRPSLLAGPADGRAFPTPRSWETAAVLLGAARAASVAEEVVALLVAGAVGDGAARELAAWRRDLDLPDPEALLADPSSLVVPERGDRVHAVCAAVTAAALGDPSPERWVAAWEVLARVADAGFADVGATSAVALAGARPAGATAPKAATRFAPVLAAAGRM